MLASLVDLLCESIDVYDMIMWNNNLILIGIETKPDEKKTNEEQNNNGKKKKMIFSIEVDVFLI